MSAIQSTLNITFDLERGRRDSSYNNIIIEFKGKGFFNGRANSAKFREAMDDRLAKYIPRLAQEQRLDPSDYIGIAIDGNHIAFAQWLNGGLQAGPLLPLSATSVGLVCAAIKAGYRRAVTNQNLIADFGPASPAGIGLMQELADLLSTALAEEGGNKITMLFQEWRTLYGQISDAARRAAEACQAELRFQVAVSADLLVPASLFIIHTYNSLLMKLLAAEIIASHGLTAFPSFSQNVLAQPAAQLPTTLAHDIEGGAYFNAAGIKGFVEEAIFSWYLSAFTDDQTNEPLLTAIRTLLARLSLYRTDKLEVAQATDVLKSFYQNLVPDVLRRSLGEFYTPDWLVKYSVDKVAPATWQGVRALDPTCGSGSFLLEVIRRKRQQAQQAGLSAGEQLDELMQTVWGFDLNPLAVQTARVNYLIAVADLLAQVPGHEIEVPVLLADAVYSPARQPYETEDVVRYRVGSEVADLEVVLPATLSLDRPRLDQVFTLLGAAVELDKEPADALATLVTHRAITAAEAQQWAGSLTQTYQNVLRLHRRNWNGIWFRIVRNFFWSATAGEFDVIIGNPPWVRWASLPPLYRERVKPTCEQYDIFSSTPFSGGNSLDISGLITYTVADKWLKPNGKLVFVLTQTLFQNPSSEGFRRFQINASTYLIPREIDDLKALKPFADASNSTAVAVFEKTTVPEDPYPVAYRVWDRSEKNSRTIPALLSPAEVMARVMVTPLEARPVGGLGSPWAILPAGRHQQLAALQGTCDWVQGRKGITADLNGIYFVTVDAENAASNRVQITTRPEAGRTDIGPKRQFWIEPDLLYPLLKGASDIGPCRLTRAHNLFTLVPNQGISRQQYATAENQLAVDLPLTARYFQHYSTALARRSTYRLRMPGAPFYAVYSVGSYTFAPYKVVWAEQGTFGAAVVTHAPVPLQGEKPFVPDHKLFFADFDHPEPAYYLCGLLNAPSVKEYIESHNISIQLGDVFKHLTLPAFDEQNPQHTALSALVEQTHSCDQIDYPGFLQLVKDTADAILVVS
ncbi:Eco57I restriction-modification methylase domain-containing protein [Hymenobacter rubripertinctus]|uniref:site-specific DNA-methyltransferase (adenine-specific) n=1 Tax=Hymenobacter rubripertinctus TaxID=2029981 RepID=A0A418QXZ5_9BACT|nr:N-6 DNA methylase [Hymenobacter rubripertinctus]RIY10043.1 SAM-dependent DNA methyltransferase [Hymenobacter rubripertinctus]